VAYITRTDLENAMGAGVVLQIFDDLNTGSVNDDAVTLLITEAEARVNSFLRQLYIIPLSPVPDLVRSIALDVATAIAQARHPELVRADGEKLMKRAEADLDKLRAGTIKVDSMTLPTPRNAIITVGSGIAATPAPLPKVFGDDMGDF
jgi:phage gp36-like protein